MKKQISNFINKLDSKYLMKMIMGLIVTIKCKELAYIERGYFGIGGEYLVVPLYLTVKNIIKYLIDQREKETIKERVEKVNENIEAA